MTADQSHGAFLATVLAFLLAGWMWSCVSPPRCPTDPTCAVFAGGLPNPIGE